MGTVILSDFSKFGEFAKESIDFINKEMDDRDEILELLNSLWFYGSCVNAWCNYRVKWGLDVYKRQGQGSEKRR